jgi:WD40 repeat protein
LLWIAVCAPPLAAADELMPTIVPVLVDRCLVCHDEEQPEGGYQVTTFQQLFRPGDSQLTPVTGGDVNASELYQRLISSDPDRRMPADGPPLDERQIAAFSQWIQQGASVPQDRRESSLVELLEVDEPREPPAHYPVRWPITAILIDDPRAEVIVGGYHELLVYDRRSGALVRRISGLSERVMDLDLSVDGLTLAVAGGTPGRRGDVRLLDWPAGTAQARIAHSNDLQLCVAYAPAGDRLFVAGADGKLTAIEVDSRSVVASFHGHSDWILGLAVSKDGYYVATASRDGTAKRLSADQLRVEASFVGHGRAVTAIALTEDGQRAFSGDERGGLMAWSSSGEEPEYRQQVGGSVMGVRLLANSVYVLSSTDGPRRFDRDQLTPEPWGLPTAAGYFTTLAAGEDRLAWGSDDRSFRMVIPEMPANLLGPIALP